MNFGKRIDKPSGCRKALREDILIRAAMMTTTDSMSVDLLDLSKSGAKLRGENLPAPGQEVLVLIGRLEAFGSIIWREEDECGVHFDVALSDNAFAMVQSERGPTQLLGIGSEAVLASADWESGLAR